MKKFLMPIFIFCLGLLILTGCSLQDSEEIERNPKEKKHFQTEDAENTVQHENEQENLDEIVDNAIEELSVPEKHVTEVVYQEVLPYLDNRIVVKQAGLYGIIDNVGNIVMPIDKPYRIQPTINSAVFVDNEKCGVLSLGGEVLIPAIYDGGKILSDDLILLQKIENDDTIINRIYSNRYGLDIELSGLINSTVVVGDRFYAIGVGDFAKEDCCIKIITFDGEIIDVSDFTPYMHDNTDASGSGVSSSRFKGAIYKTSENKEYLVTQKLLIDELGNIIVDLTKENACFVFDEDKGFCCSDEIIISDFTKTKDYRRSYTHYVFNLISHKKERITALNNNTKVGEDVLANGFYEISTPGGNGYKCYYGLMNDKYEVIAEPIYESIEDCVNGYFPVELNEHWGYVDEHGDVLLPQFEDDKIQRYNRFAYNYTSDEKGGLIHPKTGDALPYRKVDHIDLKYSDFWMCLAILTDEETGEEYKSFVTWDGPITEHRFPNDRITVSNDGKVAVYNKGAVYTIVEL